MSSSSSFVAQRIARSAIIRVNTSVNKAFPLFTPQGERHWVPGWNPCILYPDSEVMEEGLIFQTQAKFPGESPYTWQVIRYDVASHQATYLVWTKGRTWTIAVHCKEAGLHQTSVEVTYSFTSLNPEGHKLNDQALDMMFAHDLKDWEEAVNYYLETGKCIAN